METETRTLKLRYVQGEAKPYKIGGEAKRTITELKAFLMTEIYGYTPKDKATIDAIVKLLINVEKLTIPLDAESMNNAFSPKKKTYRYDSPA